MHKPKRYDIIIVKGGEYHMATSDKTKNIITVYHGSTYLFETIDVAKGKPYKDFGRGFYVTENFNHAKTLAVRNKMIETAQYSRDTNAYVYIFEFDLTSTKKNFSVKEFKDADLAWMEFVLANRKVRERSHDYDVVLGPTANDDTSIVLKAYFSGLYGDIGSTGAIETALRLIEADKLPSQIYFANNSATKFLTQKGQVTIL